MLIQFTSVTQSSLTLCNPMDCSTPGFPVHHQHLELAQTHVHLVSDAIQPISSSVIPFSSCLQSFPAEGAFLMSQLFASGGQTTGGSASASVLPKSIQDSFPLGWTGLISLQSEGLPRVFSNTTVQKHQFFGTCCCCCCYVASVVSDSVRPHRRQAAHQAPLSLGFSRQ